MFCVLCDSDLHAGLGVAGDRLGDEPELVGRPVDRGAGRGHGEHAVAGALRPGDRRAPDVLAGEPGRAVRVGAAAVVVEPGRPKA